MEGINHREDGYYKNYLHSTVSILPCAGDPGHSDRSLSSVPSPAALLHFEDYVDSQNLFQCSYNTSDPRFEFWLGVERQMNGTDIEFQSSNVYQPQDLQKPWATTQEWEKHREKLTRLYWHEGMTLTNVKTIMEKQDNFYATERMYKTRFKAWGLLKNIKRAESVAIVNSILQQDATGQDSEVWFRGKKVSFRRRLRRQNIHEDHAAGVSVSLPSYVKILSLPPSSINARGVSEIGFKIIQEYVLCELATNAGQFCVEQEEHYSWYRSWYDGCSMLFDSTGQNPTEAGRLLNIAFASTKPALHRHNGHFLIYYLRALVSVSMRYPSSVGVCDMLARYTKQMSEAVIGQSHPLTRLLAFLAANKLGFNGNSSMGLLGALTVAYISQLEIAFELPQTFLTHVRAHNLRLLYKTGVYESNGNQLLLEQLSRLMKDQLDTFGARRESDYLFLQNEMAYFLSRSKREEQRKQALDLVTSALQSKAAQDDLDSRWKLLYTARDTAISIGLWERAIAWQQELVRLTKQEHGGISAKYLDILYHTRSLLETKGVPSELEEIYAEIKYVLAQREREVGAEPLAEEIMNSGLHV